MTSRSAGHPFSVEGVPNLRDLGGWPTGTGGRVRSAVVYRSTELFRLGDGGRKTFDELGINTVYDLRTAGERAAAPDPTLDGVAEVPLDVLADSATALPANLTKAFSDPESVAQMSEVLAGGRGAELMTGTYRQIISLPSALKAYQVLFTGLAGGRPGPSLFHCTTGKDRTGWAAAALLSVLGVDIADVYRDYLLTNDQLLSALHPVFAGFEAAGGDPSTLPAVLGVEKVYLDTAFDEMRTLFGDIEGYFRNGLGIDETTLQTLRDKLVEPL